ncbi:MAG: PEP-CTERM sorting domain-containing protein [Candidatus Eisenbacteria bacterium]|nr:PEP-CTERM sorting domain-containing protein [Candidatus Eisenbacteria bacterium]
MRCARVLAATALLVAILATASWAGYTTEIIFSAEGWYLSDAGSGVGTGGYGTFEELDFTYTVDSNIPEGTHCLYFMPDVTMRLRPETPGEAPVRHIGLGASGVDFDGQVASWESMGLTWAPGYGLVLGEHFMPAMNPGAVVGSHAWDLDGGGDDFAADVWAAKGASEPFAPSSFGATFEMRRSLTWLSGQPIGTWFSAGLAPILGGLPLDGLDEALNGLAPGLAEWDAVYYEMDYEGTMRLSACAEPVPEPSTLLLLSGGLGALLVARRRKRSPGR